MGKDPYPPNPWDHADWYDLHDRESTAGAEREPEHYHELLIALPPLDSNDHLIDVGAGTGKLSTLIAQGYPHLGLVTLIEPNEDKLQKARLRLKDILGADRIRISPAKIGLGENVALAKPATIAVVGSVLMPLLEQWQSSPQSATDWMHRALTEIRQLLAPQGWLYVLETTTQFWIPSAPREKNRRLTPPELHAEMDRAGFESVECVYRFRDRVIFRGRS